MDVRLVWDRVLESMRGRIGHQDVEIWLKDAHPIRIDGSEFVLEAVNQYYGEWIRDTYSEHLHSAISEAVGRVMTLTVVWRDDATAETQPERLPEPPSDSHSRKSGVNHAQTFGSFVIGECNKFAHAAARAVADEPAERYNPLFIYGATGLGKTHLIHAIANQISSMDPQSRIVYVTAEDFMNEMINGLRYGRMEDFRAKYRKRVTVLLIDDIQFLSGKDRTQEEFFHTFNALQASGRQIVLTSDVVPRDIEKLAPRLRTRFEGGLLADMQAPDKETLVAILRRKLDTLELTIPPDLADAIANTVAGNIRELEGILNRLAAVRSFYDQPLTLEFARRQMPDLFAPEPTQITVPSIITAVATFHNLKPADLLSTKRTRMLTRPRHIAMYTARMHTDLSFPELGREFGGRDHSTIQHGFKKIRNEREVDPDLDTKIRLILKSLGIT